MRILAFDPGGKGEDGGTGWALLEDYEVVQIGKMKYGPELFAGVRELPDAEVWVIENYRVRPQNFSGKNKFAHRWSEVYPVRAIGAIESEAHRRGIQVAFQEPANKTIGYKVAGLTPPKDKKKEHMFDAIAHGSYWFHVNIGPKGQGNGTA